MICASSDSLKSQINAHPSENEAQTQPPAPQKLVKKNTILTIFRINSDDFRQNYANNSDEIVRIVPPNAFFEGL
jgi:hypothetical protein